MNRLILVAACAGLCLTAAPALAQFSPSGLPGGGKAPPKPEAPPAPDALPGAHADKTRVTPADKGVAADLEPNEALFDAINRGDIASARDAISRGADLGSKNLLGLTPLELSVDLGRNDITFLLLSFRGLDESGRRGPPPATAATASAHGRPPRGARTAAEAGPTRAPSQAARGLPAATPRSAQLYAGNGGAPVPSAGFLGFDQGTAR